MNDRFGSSLCENAVLLPVDWLWFSFPIDSNVVFQEADVRRDGLQWLGFARNGLSRITNANTCGVAAERLPAGGCKSDQKSEYKYFPCG